MAHNQWGLGLVAPDGEGTESREFGKAIHGVLEGIFAAHHAHAWHPENPHRHEDPPVLDDLQRVQLAAVMECWPKCAPDLHWLDENRWQALAIEAPVYLPLLDTEECLVVCKGKIDLLLREVETGRTLLIDHKAKRAFKTINSRVESLDRQAVYYPEMVEYTLGTQVNEQVRHYLKIPSFKLVRESLEDHGERVKEAIMGEPAEWFCSLPLQMSPPSRVEEALLRDSRRVQRILDGEIEREPGGCNKWGQECPYIAYCLGEMDIADALSHGFRDRYEPKADW